MEGGSGARGQCGDQRGAETLCGLPRRHRHVTRELASVEDELAGGVIVERPEMAEGGRELSMGPLLSIPSGSGSVRSHRKGLCPRSHGEAMSSPHARNVRDAEVNEFILNNTFGPLSEGVAPGPL